MQLGSVYRHYKGGQYLLLHLAETCEHNGDFDAVYVVLSTGKVVTRPLRQDSRKADAWTDEVTWPDGELRRRFVPQEELLTSELAALQKKWEATR